MSRSVPTRRDRVALAPRDPDTARAAERRAAARARPAGADAARHRRDRARLQPARRDHQPAADLPGAADPARPVRRDGLRPGGDPGHLLRRRLRLRRRARPAARRGTGAAGRDHRADGGPGAPRGRAVGPAVPRHDSRRGRHRGDERPAVQPDQAALAGAGGDADRPLHHRAVGRRDRGLGRQRAAVAGQRRLAAAHPRLAGRPGGAGGAAVAAAAEGGRYAVKISDHRIERTRATLLRSPAPPSARWRCTGTRSPGR